MELTPLLRFMIDRGGSDLYLTPGAPPAMKVNGQLAWISKQTIQPGDTIQLITDTLNEHQLQSFEEQKELNLALSYSNLGRFRVNLFHQRGTVGLVVRRIYDQIPSFDALNLPTTIAEIISAPRGLVLVVGSTGSGKSTTLAAMVDYRNASQAGHIITIEDPIEYLHRHKGSIVNQREIGIDTHHWGSALENALRQVPDVILIGEIRSADVMEYALNFADTGHLTISTLHANNADQTLERILGFFGEERYHQTLMDLSLNLRAIISQRLIPRADGQGQIPAVELLLNSPNIADLIYHGKLGGLKEAVAQSRNLGMQTFDQALIDLYKQELITSTQALKHADSANDVRLAIKQEELRERGQPESAQFEIDHNIEGTPSSGFHS